MKAMTTIEIKRALRQLITLNEASRVAARRAKEVRDTIADIERRLGFELPLETVFTFDDHVIEVDEEGGISFSACVPLDDLLERRGSPEVSA